VLLLEDLAASGCRFSGGSTPVSLAEARAVVTALGRLHAAFWESPRFAGDLAWLRSSANNPHRRLEWWLSARSNGPALAKFRDLVPAEIRANAHRIHARRTLLEAHWARAPKTLIHGDPHAGNLYFDDGEAGFFDWQVVQVGPGLRDVSYFLVNSLGADVEVLSLGQQIAYLLEEAPVGRPVVIRPRIGLVPAIDFSLQVFANLQEFAVARAQVIDNGLQGLPELGGGHARARRDIVLQEVVENRCNVQAALLDSISHREIPYAY